jgi:myo-inositol-1(or 4)-monophosphatase
MISEQDQRHYLAIARRAAAEAAEVIRTHAPGRLTEKGDRDPVSEVDLAVERFVRDFLHNKTPEIGFLGEEEGGNSSGHELLWVLDPIDGTVNFLHGSPLCAVSLKDPCATGRHAVPAPVPWPARTSALSSLSP